MNNDGGDVYRPRMPIKRAKTWLRERRLWAKARTLEDLGELTAQWLEGRIAHQPGYYGPVDVDEDLAPGMRDTLVRLNRAGFVTNDSQAGYDNLPWTQHAAVTGFARDETVQRLRPALQRAGYVAATDDYTDTPGGVHVTFRDGRPYTSYGHQLDLPVLEEEFYPGVSAAAIDDLCGVSQLTIYDPQTGRNTLWAALDEAVFQPEQENTTMSLYDHDSLIHTLIGTVRDEVEVGEILGAAVADMQDRAGSVPLRPLLIVEDEMQRYYHPNASRDVPEPLPCADGDR